MCDGKDDSGDTDSDSEHFQHAQMCQKSPDTYYLVIVIDILIKIF